MAYETLIPLDVSYDDKAYGNKIDPYEWNENFKQIENNVNRNIAELQLILTNHLEQLSDRYTAETADAKIGEETKDLIQNFDVDLNTGIITVTKKDGTVETHDTAMEKIPATFSFVEKDNSYYLKIVNQDGSSSQVDVTSLMNLYSFLNSDELSFTVNTNGNKNTVTANLRDNSITLKKMSAEVISRFEEIKEQTQAYATEAKTHAENAALIETNTKKVKEETIAIKEQANSIKEETAAIKEETNSIKEETAVIKGQTNDIKEETATIKEQTNAIKEETSQYVLLSKSYANGDTSVREGEDIDNAKYYAQKAKEEADRAKEIVGSDYITQTEFQTARTEILNTAAENADGKIATMKTEILNTTAADATNKAMAAKTDAVNTITNQKGNVGGFASLDADGKVPPTQLPSSEIVEATLLAASWTGSSVPYIYTLNLSGVTATSNQEFLPPTQEGGLTAGILTALQAANLQDGGQSTDSVIILAYGIKPTIDLPIRVVLRGEI